MPITLHDLVKQRADLDAQIEAAKAADFHTAGHHAAYLFGGEAAAALLTLHNRSARPQRAEVAPKYRATGLTWTGRGREPKWFAAAEQLELAYLSGDLA